MPEKSGDTFGVEVTWQVMLGEELVETLSTKMVNNTILKPFPL